jgi:hypothetical protein
MFLTPFFSTWVVMSPYMNLSIWNGKGKNHRSDSTLQTTLKRCLLVSRSMILSELHYTHSDANLIRNIDDCMHTFQFISCGNFRKYVRETFSALGDAQKHNLHKCIHVWLMALHGNLPRLSCILMGI